MFKLLTFVFFTILYSSNLLALNVDSLLNKADEILYDDTEKAISLCFKSLEFVDDDKQVFQAYTTLGDAYFLLGRADECMLYHSKSYEVAEMMNDEYLISKAYIGLGLAYEARGELEKGLEYYFKALDLREKQGDEKEISIVLNNIAVSYYNQEKIDEAISYMKQCVALDVSVGDSAGIGYSYSNLGSFYYYNDNHDSSLFYHNKALEIRMATNNQFLVARSYNNIANVLVDIERIDDAIVYYKKAIDIKRTLKNPYELAIVLSNMGKTLSQNNRPEPSLELLLEAGEIFEELGSLSSIKDNNYALARTYSLLGQHDSSYQVLSRAYQLSKIIYDESRSEQIEEMMEKFETEQTEKENQLLHAQRAEDALNMERSSKRNLMLIGGILLIAILALGIFSRLRTNRKNTRVLKDLYNELEAKNTDILDSIQYAKRIQNAILPSKSSINELMPDSFILYKPKDVVAGDFYWLEQKEGKTLLAVADCTGHGVPGAMVSVVCNNALNRSVREHGLTQPSEILNKTREIVVQEFEKSEEKVRDGMDISLVSLEGTDLQYAGAFNSLWIIKDGMDEVFEVKADKQPIGKYENRVDFTNHKMELSKGDIIYLFSDGFADQFGGEKGKKFKAGNLKMLLLTLKQKTLKEQGEALEISFEKWRGSLEQLDDVCIIGLKI